jgi:hypothetical protein
MECMEIEAFPIGQFGKASVERDFEPPTLTGL